MIKVDNEYDFTVDELTDILENTPLIADIDSNKSVAEYIIQSLNINRIIKESQSAKRAVVCKQPVVEEKPTIEINRTEYRGSPYHLIITKNEDNNAKVFECDARSIAFYAYDPLLGKPHKAILCEQTPTPTDIANISEYLGSINGWGTLQ